MKLLTLLTENNITTPVTEDYPTAFDMAHFKSLTSFNQRIQYCEKYLQRLSSGSSRIVYKIDDQKVLKLAKNTKGLAQNEHEADLSDNYSIKPHVAEIFDYHPDYLWIEMELAQRITAAKFKQITGVSLKDFAEAVMFSQKNSFDKPRVPQEVLENEFVKDIIDLVHNYDFNINDLVRPSSYGIVSRNGQEHVVIIDYGLSMNVFNKHYAIKF